jgi:hypothetical protein
MSNTNGPVPNQELSLDPFDSADWHGELPESIERGQQYQVISDSERILVVRKPTKFSRMKTHEVRKILGQPMIYNSDTGSFYRMPN